jgi:hypothetical protein
MGGDAPVSKQEMRPPPGSWEKDMPPFPSEPLRQFIAAGTGLDSGVSHGITGH